MTESPASPKAYIESLPAERQAPVRKLRALIRKHLPKGFKEEINYKMIGYVVPHQLYPDGYHCNPRLPLPFMNLASQKNYIAVYHMGIYSDPTLLNWFVQEYAQRVEGKLDMGKCCIRFKKIQQIPYELIGELAEKITPSEWIAIYKNSQRQR